MDRDRFIGVISLNSIHWLKRIRQMNTGMTCIFCELVMGKKPSSRVYEDDISMGFMGIRPLHPGELMVIPKKHIDHFSDIPDELAAHILIVAQKFSRMIREVLSPQRVGLVVHGYGVPHAHLLVVPLQRSTDITSARYAHFVDGELAFSEQQVSLASRSELDEIASLLSGRSLDWVRKGPR